MFQGLQGWHFIILLVIILLLFGAPRLPALARSLGQSMRIFKGEMKQAKKDDEDPAAGTVDSAVADPASPTQAPSTPAADAPGSTAAERRPGDAPTQP